MKCENCGHDVADGALFCENCGGKIEKEKKQFCGNCGAEMKPGAAFCGNCGATVNSAESVVDDAVSSASDDTMYDKTVAIPIGSEIKEAVKEESSIPFEQKTFCGNCGAEMTIGATFCGNCGAVPYEESYNDTIEEDDLTRRIPTDEILAYEEEARRKSEPAIVAPPPKKKSKTPVIILVVSLIVVLISGAALGYMWVSGVFDGDESAYSEQDSDKDNKEDKNENKSDKSKNKEKKELFDSDGMSTLELTADDIKDIDMNKKIDNTEKWVTELIATEESEEEAVPDSSVPENVDDKGYATYTNNSNSYTCKYPSWFNVTVDDGVTFTCTSPDELGIMTISSSLANGVSPQDAKNNYVISLSGTVDYESVGDDYFAARVKVGTSYYYKYAHFVNGMIHEFSFVFPEGQFDSYDMMINDIYAEFVKQF